MFPFPAINCQGTIPRHPSVIVPTLPHVADANARLSLTAEGVVVSGAGTAEANSFYHKTNVEGDHAQYNIIGYSISTSSISWDVNRWKMYGSTGIGLYRSITDVDVDPWDATWLPWSGVAPAPTVTHTPGQVTGAGYQVIQDADSGDGPNHTYTFNGDGADADAGLMVPDLGFTYSPRGTNEGKNYYNQIGFPDDPTSAVVVWEDDGHGGFVWANRGDGGGSYDTSPDDVEFPWLSSAWSFPPQRNPIAGPDNWDP